MSGLKTINNYVLGKMVGKGAFGYVYPARDSKTNKLYAIKIHKKTRKSSIENETSFLKELNGSNYFPKYIESGTFYVESKKETVTFLVMEFLGPSLDRIRDKAPKDTKYFSLSTGCRIAIETLRSIRAFHQLGYVHRDIKPSNFLVRPSARYPVALIDYGLSKKYKDEDGSIIKQKFVGFAGTVKYASPNAFFGQELGRCDDLYSWFLTVLDLILGRYPWSSLKSKRKEEVGKIKREADMVSFLLSHGLPVEFAAIYTYIVSLKYEEEPKYDNIIALLVRIMANENINWEDAYDWENYSEKRLKLISDFPFSRVGDEKPDIPTGLPDVENVIIQFKVSNNTSTAMALDKGRGGRSLSHSHSSTLSLSDYDESLSESTFFGNRGTLEVSTCTTSSLTATSKNSDKGSKKRKSLLSSRIQKKKGSRCRPDQNSVVSELNIQNGMAPAQKTPRITRRKRRATSQAQKARQKLVDVYKEKDEYQSVTLHELEEMISSNMSQYYSTLQLPMSSLTRMALSSTLFSSSNYHTSQMSTSRIHVNQPRRKSALPDPGVNRKLHTTVRELEESMDKFLFSSAKNSRASYTCEKRSSIFDSDKPKKKLIAPALFDTADDAASSKTNNKGPDEVAGNSSQRGSASKSRRKLPTQVTPEEKKSSKKELNPSYCEQKSISSVEKLQGDHDDPSNKASSKRECPPTDPGLPIRKSRSRDRKLQLSEYTTSTVRSPTSNNESSISVLATTNKSENRDLNSLSLKAQIASRDSQQYLIEAQKDQTNATLTGIFTDQHDSGQTLSKPKYNPQSDGTISVEKVPGGGVPNATVIKYVPYRHTRVDRAVGSLDMTADQSSACCEGNCLARGRCCEI